MKQGDPCGFCHRPLRVGDSFHEVVLTEPDRARRPAGRYSNICGECAGVPWARPILIPGQKKPCTCALCHRVYPQRKYIFERLRIKESDDTGLEPGLHAMCKLCFDVLSKKVAEARAKPFVSEEWPTPTKEVAVEVKIVEVDDGRTPRERYDEAARQALHAF